MEMKIKTWVFNEMSLESIRTNTITGKRQPGTIGEKFPRLQQLVVSFETLKCSHPLRGLQPRNLITLVMCCCFTIINAH